MVTSTTSASDIAGAMAIGATCGRMKASKAERRQRKKPYPPCSCEMAQSDVKDETRHRDRSQDRSLCPRKHWKQTSCAHPGPSTVCGDMSGVLPGLQWCGPVWRPILPGPPGHGTDYPNAHVPALLRVPMELICILSCV